MPGDEVVADGRVHVVKKVVHTVEKTTISYNLGYSDTYDQDERVEARVTVNEPALRRRNRTISSVA